MQWRQLDKKIGFFSIRCTNNIDRAYFPKGKHVAERGLILILLGSTLPMNASHGQE